jgi:long-chain acyl-CoA synthetase
MRGYYNKPEATEEAFRGGWFHSGDLGRKDEEGYYYLADRKHDMIISGGENIYPAEIEEIITQLKAVSEVAVIGVPNEQWGEEVKAIVQLKNSGEITEQDILDHCKENLAGYKRPRSVLFVDDFPRTATGKILKRILRKPFWEGQERSI